MGDADRRREPGFGAQRVAAGDEDEIVRPAAQLVGEVGDQSSNRQSSPTTRTSASRGTGFGGGEDGGFDPAASIRASGRPAGKSASSTSKTFVALSPAAARRGAHRPYSRKRRPPRQLARGAERDQAVEQAPRGAVGHRRVAGGFGRARRNPRRVCRSTTFWLPVSRRSFGATTSRASERRERSAARSRAEAAASAIAPAAAFCQAGSPGLRPPPAFGDRSAGSRIFVAISGKGRGPAQPNGDGDVEHPKRENFGFGRWGVREGGERQGGGLCGRRDRIALPCASLQARCEAVRVRQSQVEPRRRVKIRPGSRLGGRPARSRHSRSSLAGGPELLADGEAQVAQRAFVGVEAEDLGASPGALKRQAGAQRPGGGRVAAQEGVEQSASPAPAANSGSPSPALPLARAQAGIGAGGGKAWCSGVFA